MRTGSVSAERVGQEEVGGVTHRVTCTWWLVRLGCQSAMVGPSGPIPALAAWTGLERVGQWEVGGLLGLAVKVPRLGPGGPIPALAAWTGLKNASLTL